VAYRGAGAGDENDAVSLLSRGGLTYGAPPPAPAISMLPRRLTCTLGGDRAAACCSAGAADESAVGAYPTGYCAVGGRDAKGAYVVERGVERIGRCSTGGDAYPTGYIDVEYCDADKTSLGEYEGNRACGLVVGEDIKTMLGGGVCPQRETARCCDEAPSVMSTLPRRLTCTCGAAVCGAYAAVRTLRGSPTC
jgi:hypothetical protein